MRIFLTLALVLLVTTVFAAPVAPSVEEQLIGGAASGLEQRLSGLSLETSASRGFSSSRPPALNTVHLPEGRPDTPSPDSPPPSINHRTASAPRRKLERLPKFKFKGPGSGVGKSEADKTRAEIARKAANAIKAIQAEGDSAAVRGYLADSEQGQGSSHGWPNFPGNHPEKAAVDDLYRVAN